MDTIFEATKSRCIAEQMEVRTAHRYMSANLQEGAPGTAMMWQKAAANAHEEMRIRLEQLIGVA